MIFAYQLRLVLLISLLGLGWSTSISASASAGPMAFVGTIESLVQSGTFPDSTINADHTANLTIENWDPTYSVRIDTINAGQFSSPFTVMNDSCSGVTLVPWNSCTISLKFHPTAEQTYTNNIDIPYTIDPLGGATARTMAYTLNGTGIRPVAQVTDTVGTTSDQTLAFGNIVLSTNDDKVVTIKNSGTGTLELDALGATNGIAAPFNVPGSTDNCSWAWLWPNDTCTFVIRFAPTVSGAYSDTFSINSNDPDNPIITFTVSGIGGVPDIDVTDLVGDSTDLSVDFGDVAAGSGMVDQTIAVQNIGNAVLDMGITGTGDGLAAPFSIVNDTCSSANLAVNDICTITVRFSPSGLGAAADSFAINSLNDPDEAAVTFNLSGKGVTPPTLTVTDDQGMPDDLASDFGEVTEGLSQDQTITVSNSGALNLVLGNIAATDQLAVPFSLIADTCSGVTLTPAASCGIEVRFAPSMSGSFTDTIDIPSNDPAIPSRTFSFAGTGTPTPVPQLAFSEATTGFMANVLEFGTHSVGTSLLKNIRIANSGSAALVISNVSSTISDAAFSFDASKCKSIEPESSCEIGVSFKAGETGAQLILVIASNDPDTPSLQLSCHGTGQKAPKATIQVEDSSGETQDGKVDFGEVPVGVEQMVAVKVVNAGTADLTIGKVAAKNPLMKPFNLAKDQCSDQTLSPTASCQIDVTLKPDRTGAVNDAFDIPSNDTDKTSVTLQVNAVIAAESGNSSPGIPKLMAPLNGAVVSGATAAALQWEGAGDPDNDEVSYKVHLCQDESFTNCEEVSASIMTWLSILDAAPTSFPVSGLAGLALAVVFVLFGRRPDFNRKSAERRCATLTACALVPLTFCLSCKSSLNTKITANSRVKQQEGATLLEHVVPPPIAPGTYFWKVTAVDARGAWTESQVWSFTVE